MEKDSPRALAPTSTTFLDTRFRNRVVIFPDGSMLYVSKGEAVAQTASHVEYLDAHPDFKRLEDRA
ncbi:hypothetical protein WS62_31365 [Burkholderia sp. ABCPW 14]|uniref:hypothetical protein n=1 Tax=Burkholderia sp. ABCPW 14 TaxID=1637860 RepID=UPI000770C803|nr:hypothetical protein [Burkholderia sp. ABCPW 14]KVD76986.1 hypothetical protein WS62_31365 [Burkholderia sp. ABCPW 14]